MIPRDDKGRDIETPSIPGPRIPPGSRREIGLVNAGLARFASREVDASHPLNVFTTLARHRKLFRVWAMFARRLLGHGELDRLDTELVILRVAHNCRCTYEWEQHVRIASDLGIKLDLIASMKARGPVLRGGQRLEALLRAADELHCHRDLSDDSWRALRAELSDVQIIELCMLVGHYEMVAMTLNGLRVVTDVVQSTGCVPREETEPVMSDAKEYGE